MVLNVRSGLARGSLLPLGQVLPGMLAPGCCALAEPGQPARQLVPMPRGELAHVIKPSIHNHDATIATVPRTDHPASRPGEPLYWWPPPSWPGSGGPHAIRRRFAAYLYRNAIHEPIKAGPRAARRAAARTHDVVPVAVPAQEPPGGDRDSRRRPSRPSASHRQAAGEQLLARPSSVPGVIPGLRRLPGRSPLASGPPPDQPAPSQRGLSTPGTAASAGRNGGQRGRRPRLGRQRPRLDSGG